MSSPRGLEFMEATAPFIAFATISVGLRLYTRICISRNPGWEDFIVTISLLCAIVLFSIMAWLAINHGMGKHMIELNVAEMASLSEFAMGFWVAIYFYNLTLATAKGSIFLQYVRLFPGWTKRVSWVCIGLVSGKVIASIVLNLFFCTPIQKFWRPALKGHCLNIKTAWTIFAATNILTDVLAIVVPIPAVLKLKLARKSKILLLTVFSLGLLDVVIAILRIRSLQALAKEMHDITYHARDVALWSTLESTVAVICVSLPVLRPLGKKWFPNMFSAHGPLTQSTDHELQRGSRMEIEYNTDVTQRSSIRDEESQVSSKHDKSAFSSPRKLLFSNEYQCDPGTDCQAA